MPRKIVILHEPGEKGREIEALLPLLKDQIQINNKTTFYICENFACKMPTNSARKAKQLLTEK